LITDAKGLPLAVRITPANVPDGRMLVQMLDSIPAIAGPRGRPRFRPDILQGDHAYGWQDNIAAVRARHVRSQLGRPCDTAHDSGLGKTRYVVERTLAWIGHRRRLKICYEKTGWIFQAFHDLTLCLICANKLAAANMGF